MSRVRRFRPFANVMMNKKTIAKKPRKTQAANNNNNRRRRAPTPPLPENMPEWTYSTRRHLSEERAPTRIVGGKRGGAAGKNTKRTTRSTKRY